MRYRLCHAISMASPPFADINPCSTQRLLLLASAVHGLPMSTANHPRTWPLTACCILTWLSLHVAVIPASTGMLPSGNIQVPRRSMPLAARSHAVASLVLQPVMHCVQKSSFFFVMLFQCRLYYAEIHL